MNSLKLSELGVATTPKTEADRFVKRRTPNRRSEDRLPCLEQATCFWIDPEGSRQSQAIQVLDRSEDGLGFRVSHRLESGQTVWVEIDSEVFLKGVVRFCEWEVDGYRAGLVQVHRERRRFDREPSGGAGTLYWADDTNRRISAPVIIRNQTSGGLQLEIPVAIPVSTVIRLSGSVLECQGVVRYCRRTEGHHLIGIEFLGIPHRKNTVKHKSVSKIRVALADDQPVFRDSLRELLSAKGFEVVADTGDDAEIVAMLERYSPDVLLLDITMRQFGGLSALKHVRSLNLPTKIIVLTASTDKAALLSAMRFVASGIVTKDKPTEFLVEGIRKVHAGDICADAKTKLLLMQQFSSPCRSVAKLSQREYEVLTLLCEGLKNREIADRIFLSEETVKSHLAHMFEKAGVSNRTHLVLHAFETGLVPDRSARLGCTQRW